MLDALIRALPRRGRAPEGLQGKRVLITGASSGIGVEAAERFARAGADLALLARGQGLAEAGRRARAHDVEAHEIHVDVTDRPGLHRAVTGAVEALGGLDVAVLNAGVATWGPFREIAPEDFDRAVEVTFGGVVDATRLVLPALEQSGGTIVITGSVAGKVPFPLMASYVAAKHAVRGFAGALRMELAGERSRVRVAMVHPGPVDTPFWSHAATPPGRENTPTHGSYSAAAVARELVRMAERPRRERTVGGAMVLWQGAYRLGRPAIEPLLGATLRWKTRSPGEPARSGGLRRPSGEGRVSGGTLGRPSLWSELRALPDRLRAGG